MVSDTPGPGNYENPGYINPGNKPGGFSFGKDAPKQKPSDTPGPGSYKVPAKVADTPDYALNGYNDYKFV